MPRPHRFLAPGVPVHVVQRGNNRAACFFNARDFDFYLHVLLQVSRAERCRVHAYCLMSNHVHLLLTPEDDVACARCMKSVNQRYTQYVNRCYERSGTLWEGRYRSSAVFSARYVLACYRYIELNPVRARLARHPSGYPWSSYGANAEGMENPIVRPHGVYAALARAPVARQLAYRELVEQAIGSPMIDNIRKAIGRGQALRDDFQPEATELSTGV